MSFVEIVKEMPYLFHSYYKVTDIYSLLLTCDALNAAYRQGLVWKSLLLRDYPYIINISENHYRNWYNVIYVPGSVCCVCFKNFKEGEKCMLLCNCLNIDKYLYAHKKCIHQQKMRGMTLSQYRCHFCHDSKMTLPIYRR